MDSTTDKLRLVVAADLESEPAIDSRTQAQEQMAQILEKRRLAAKQTKIDAAFSSTSSLSKPVQSRLMEVLLANGWGKFPHGFARMLKCPRHYGLKLADISILATVYDLTVASVCPRYFAPISAQ